MESVACAAWAPPGIIPSPGEAIAAEIWAYRTPPMQSSVFMLWDRASAGGMKHVRFSVYKPSINSKSVSEVLYPTQVTPRHAHMGWVRSGERWEQESDAKTEETGWVTGTRPGFAVCVAKTHEKIQNLSVWGV